METLKNLTLVQWIGIMVGLNSLLMGATPQLTVLFGTGAVPYIIAIATLGNGALGVFVTVVGGQGNQVRNVLAMPGVEKLTVNGQANAALATIAVDQTQGKIEATPLSAGKVAATAAKAAAVLLLTIGFSLALSGGPASAQGGLKPLKPLAARSPVAAAPAAAVPAPRATATDPLSKFMADLANVQNDVVTGVIADINAADADAGTIITPAVAATDTTPAVPAVVKDPIAHACYPAEIQFLQSLPVATPTTGKYILVQLFQKKRDFVMQIQAGLPSYLKLGCAALLGDELSIFNKSMALIGVAVAGNALLPGAGGLAALPVL